VFNPIETLTGLFTMFLQIVGTGITAFFLPTIQLVIYPILSVLSLFTPA
jgi:hypothetical protein